MKAVAVQTLFIVMVIGMSIFFTFVVFNGWLGIQVPQLTSLSCAGARIEYCNALCNHKTLPNWDNKNCGDPPQSPDDCKTALPPGVCQ